MTRPTASPLLALGLAMAMALLAAGPGAAQDPASSPSPEAAAQGDPELAALFPAAVLDRTIEVTTFDARDLDEAGRANFEDVFGAALAAQGLTTDAFALGQAPFWDTTGEEYGLIGAFRVRGGDAARLIEPLQALISSQGGVAIEDIEQADLHVADRDVIRWTVLDAQGAPEDSWIYPSGEILWLISGGSSEQVEAILAQLP